MLQEKSIKGIQTPLLHIGVSRSETEIDPRSQQETIKSRRQ